MTALFLKKPDGTNFAILNLDNYCYIEGVEETTEHPRGSKSKIYFQGGYVIIVEIPYQRMADDIAKHVKDGYEYSIKMNEFNRQRQAEMLKEVMRDAHQ